MRKLVSILFLLLPLALLAQYPTNPNKARLGFQTTGDGLTYRGAGAPVYVPRIILGAWTYLDTVSNIFYAYQGGFWRPIPGARNGLSQDSGPSTGQIVLGGTLDRNTTVEALTFNWNFGRVSGATKNFISGYASGTYLGMESTVSGRGATMVMQKDGTFFETENAANSRYSHVNTTPGQVTLDAGNFVNGSRIKIFTVDTAFTFVGIDSFATHAAANASSLLRTGSLYRLNNSRVVYIREGNFGADALLTSTGTTGTVPLWTGPNTLGNSSITESGGEIIVGGTGSIRFPNGTTAQRPTHAAGKARWNTTTGFTDISDGTNWRRLTMQTDAAFGADQIPRANSQGVLFGSDKLKFSDSELTMNSTNDVSGFAVRNVYAPYFHLQGKQNEIAQFGLASGSGNYNNDALQGDLVVRVFGFSSNSRLIFGNASSRFALFSNNLTSLTTSNLELRLPSTPGINFVSNTSARLPGNNNSTSQNNAFVVSSFGVNFSDPFVFRYNGSAINQDSIRHAWEFNSSPRMRNTGTFMRWGNTARNVDYLDVRNNGEFTFGGATPVSGYLATFSATSGIVLPRGTTAQRPTATAGALRYNSTTPALEWSNGTSWFAIPSALDGNGIYSGSGSLQSGYTTVSYTGGNARMRFGNFATQKEWLVDIVDDAYEATVNINATQSIFGLAKFANWSIQSAVGSTRNLATTTLSALTQDPTTKNGEYNELISYWSGRSGGGRFLQYDSATVSGGAFHSYSFDQTAPTTAGDKLHLTGIMRGTANTQAFDRYRAPTSSFLVQTTTRGSGVNQYFDWIKVDNLDTDTTSNRVQFYGKYAIPNAAPASASGEETVMKWTGTGSAATPSFHNLKTESYNVISSTSSPQTFSSTVSDNLISQGGTQASFTFKFPPSPADGQILKFTWHTGVTSVTLDGNGNTIIGTAVTSGVAGTQRTYKFYSGVGWIRTN